MGSLLSAFGAKNEYQAGIPTGVSDQQNGLAAQLQANMTGAGPNPAQTQFQANQQANIANTQGLIASQRGLNPALAARMGANAATTGNQQAAIGSALLQQQQQLAGSQQLQGLYGQE